MSKKIELGVQAQGERCKPVILKTVAKVQGVKSMSLDSDKGVLTITGSVDVVEVVKQLRKAKRPAVVISVGPEKPPEKPGDKKDEKKDDKKDGDKKDGDKKDGDKKDGDKKDGDKKDGGKKEEKKHECSCNKPLPYCYCYHPQPSNYMPQPAAGCPQVVFYDQPPYNNCTIC